MSQQKIAILAAITIQKPSSVYQLAQVLECDFNSISKGMHSFGNNGVSTLEERRDKKNLVFQNFRLIIAGL